MLTVFIAASFELEAMVHEEIVTSLDLKKYGACFDAAPYSAAAAPDMQRWSLDMLFSIEQCGRPTNIFLIV